MANEWKIEGKKILITGGASGLGAAYAEAFLKNGAENIAILDIAEQVGKQFADTLNDTYKNKVIFVKCDVSKEEEIKNAFEEVLNAFKIIDVIINNAGIMSDSPELWKTAADVNWQGLLSFTMKGIAHMRKDQGGSGGTIINVSSTAAIARIGILPVYSGSKAAVLHFGRCIACPDFNNNTGVRILTICFGPTATPLLRNLETRLFEPKITLKILGNTPIYEQRVESAVEAVLKMFSEGTPGSIWLSRHDNPGVDITSILENAYKTLDTLILANDVPNVS